MLANVRLCLCNSDLRHPPVSVVIARRCVDAGLLRDEGCWFGETASSLCVILLKSESLAYLFLATPPPKGVALRL
jgi:hypothetical protein